ncbi:MAG: hypothetical protein WA347_01100 [Rhabdochlamydiaceae bacterium]
MSSITQIEKTRFLPQEGQRPEQVQNHIERLLNPLIARNRFHLSQVMEDAPVSQVNTLMRSVQDAIVHRIIALNQAPKAAHSQPAPVAWKDENIRLQLFYGFLNQKDRSAFELCERIRSDADNQIHGISKRVGASAREIEQEQNEVILKVREVIGKVVFVIDKLKVRAKINLDDLDSSVEWIGMGVKEKLKIINNHLKIKNKVANQFDLQEPDMLLYIEKPKEIAKVLLTSQGQLNLGMVSTVIEKFLSSGESRSGYEQGICNVLTQMDGSWQKWIDAIQPPVNGRIASNEFIRADLGLPMGHPITKLHCQQVVLGGLLSQPCQPDVADSFAVQWAIKKQNEFLLNSIEDYSALIHNGCLTRDVNGVPDHFFFKTTLADKSLSGYFTLHSNGKTEEFNDSSVWDCPNLIEAGEQMGITNLQREVMKLLVDTDSQTISWDELIEKLARSSANHHHSADELHMLGRYGFSLSDNRLLRAWETSLAAVSQDRSGDYLRDSVNSCVMNVLGPVFANSMNKASSYQKTLVEELKAVFHKTFNNSFRLAYNGSIPSSDGSSSSGGFELYSRDVEDLTSMGVRIAKPEEFKLLVFNTLDQAVSAERGKVSSKKDRAVLASVSDALKLCMHGKDFTRNILWAYDNGNRNVADPVSEYNDLERTPMQSLNGNNPWERIPINTGKDFTPDVRTIRPKDPADLLQWLLSLAKWKVSTDHFLTDSISNEGTPAASPERRFNAEPAGSPLPSARSGRRFNVEHADSPILSPGRGVDIEVRYNRTPSPERGVNVEEDNRTPSPERGVNVEAGGLTLTPILEEEVDIEIGGNLTLSPIPELVVNNEVGGNLTLAPILEEEVDVEVGGNLTLSLIPELVVNNEVGGNLTLAPILEEEVDIEIGGNLTLIPISEPVVNIQVADNLPLIPILEGEGDIEVADNRTLRTSPEPRVDVETDNLTLSGRAGRGSDIGAANRTPNASPERRDTTEVVDNPTSSAPIPEAVEPVHSEEVSSEEEVLAISREYPFHIEFENREFKSFLTGNLTPSAWIQETLIKPGLKVSEAEIEYSSKLLMQHSVTLLINNNLEQVTEGNVQDIETLFTGLNARFIKTAQYAQRLQDGLGKIFDFQGDELASFSRALDRMFLQSLPRGQLQTIQSGAVRFAKVNLDSGDESVYYCCFFNPRTEKVDFGTIDHTELQPMDQRQWVDYQQWEVDPFIVR